MKMKTAALLWAHGTMPSRRGDADVGADVGADADADDDEIA